MKKHFKRLSILLVFTLIFISTAGYTSVFAIEPISSDFVKVSPQNQVVSFRADDFQKVFIDLDGGAITKIKIKEVPSSWTQGKVYMDGKRVKDGTELSFDQIDKLYFQPKKNYCGSVDITFQLQDGRDYSNSARLTIIVDPTMEKSASISKDKNVAVYKDSPKSMELKSGSSALMGKKLEVAGKPANGRIDIADSKKGTLIYVPKTGYVGNDSVILRVTDDYDNVETMTVNFMVVDNNPTLQTSTGGSTAPAVYSDLQNHWAEYSVISLAKKGISLGEKLNNNTAFFYPDKQMSRAEFLNLVLSCSGETLTAKNDPIEFADCSNELSWIKEVVAVAYEKGLISGFEEDGKLLLKPNEAITRAEAAVILDRVVNPEIAQCIALPYRDAEIIPTWAAQSVKNMTGYGVLSGMGVTFEPGTTVTRAQAAEMCFQTIKCVQETMGRAIVQ